MEVAEAAKIVCGGSMKPDTAEELFEEEDTDGGLTRGASIKVATSCEISKIVNLSSAGRVCLNMTMMPKTI
jgi:triosephosphate isomerase